MKTQKKIEGNNRLAMAKVEGSSPLSRSILKFNSRNQLIEIPRGYRLIPAVEWHDGKPEMFRVLVPDSGKECEKSVKSRRAKSNQISA